MSIARSTHENGHATKRRKVSHDSDEEMLEPNVPSQEINGEEEGPEQSDDTNIPTKTSSSSIRNATNPKLHKATATFNTTSTSSSTLMSQTQHLLDELRPDYSSRIKKSKATADRIVEIIKTIPEHQPMSYAQVQSFSQKTLRVTIPWSQRPAVDVKYSFQCSRPTKITLEGPLIRHLTTRDNSTLSIVPEMPTECFQEKDYLNYRCFHKRAFFLACIASAIQKELGEAYRVVFTFSDGNALLPVLQVTAKDSDKAASKTIYEINPSFPESLGPIGKMLPTQNCIRKHDQADKSVNEFSNHTALYNSTIRSLASFNSFHLLIENAITKADSFRDACLLGATWLQQRHFSASLSKGGFGVQEWSLMCALLLESGGHQGRPLFSPRYSTVQFFKAMLQVLSGRDMYDPFIVRGSINLDDSSALPVLFDAKTGVNILDKMSPWSYGRLKHFATLSLAALNSRKANAFDATFVTKASDLALQYDEVYQLEGLSSSSTRSESAQQQIEFYKLLKDGLGDRAQLIDIITDSPSSWKITSSAPELASSKTTIGLLVNAETATRLVDHGPSVEEKDESQAFRKFWGEKAELRKFKDGRICESLVWTADVPVTQQIIQYLCMKHMKLSPSSIQASPSLQHGLLQSSVPADEAFATINTKFQALSSTLHHLDGLPLPIRSVSAASELIRSSSTTLPLEPGIAQPIDVVIQFDSSGRWPDNLQAIQYTKIAFLTKIGDLLTKQDRQLEVRVGIENASTSSTGCFNTSFLDVVNPSAAPSLPPIIFRLRVYHEREIHLIQQALANKFLRAQDRERFQLALQYLKQNFIADSAHTTAIRSLITQFHSLSSTIRLLKSWISAHHLSQHVPLEVLEIIAVHVFLFPAPWSAPGTPTTAFARCLHFLSQWDWSTQPLIVDLSPSQEMTIESRNELETRFAAWRQMDPNMNTVTWFVGTGLDETGVVWTQGIGASGPKPPRVIASRLTALAGAAIGLITSKSDTENQIMTKSDWTSIFTSSLDDFDFLVHLKPSVLRGNKKSKAAQFKNLQLAASLDVDTTGIDDIQSYVEDLASSFGSAAIFFYGGKYSGSNVIGGLWKPHIRGRDAKPWKIRLGYSTVPVKMAKEDENEENEGVCSVNTDGMLAEMGIMGEGLVEKITVKES